MVQLRGKTQYKEWGPKSHKDICVVHKHYEDVCVFEISEAGAIAGNSASFSSFSYAGLADAELISHNKDNSSGKIKSQLFPSFLMNPRSYTAVHRFSSNMR